MLATVSGAHNRYWTSVGPGIASVVLRLCASIILGACNCQRKCAADSHRACIVLGNRSMDHAALPMRRPTIAVVRFDGEFSQHSQGFQNCDALICSGAAAYKYIIGVSRASNIQLHERARQRPQLHRQSVRPTWPDQANRQHVRGHHTSIATLSCLLYRCMQHCEGFFQREEVPGSLITSPKHVLSMIPRQARAQFA